MTEKQKKVFEMIADEKGCNKIIECIKKVYPELTDEEIDMMIMINALHNYVKDKKISACENERDNEIGDQMRITMTEWKEWCKKNPNSMTPKGTKYGKIPKTKVYYELSEGQSFGEDFFRVTFRRWNQEKRIWEEDCEHMSSVFFEREDAFKYVRNHIEYDKIVSAKNNIPDCLCKRRIDRDCPQHGRSGDDEGGNR